MKRTCFSIIIILSAFLVASCKKTEVQPGPMGGLNIYTLFGMEIISSDGRDLLNPTHWDAILYQDVQHYYLVNGKKQLQNHPHLDSPKHLNITAPNGSPNGRYRMAVYLNVTSGENGQEIASIIEYGNNRKADTITATIVRTAHNISYTNPHINGVPVSNVHVLIKD